MSGWFRSDFLRCHAHKQVNDIETEANGLTLLVDSGFKYSDV